MCAYIYVCMYLCTCKVLLFLHITCSFFLFFLGKSAESTDEVAKVKPDDDELLCGT